MRNNYDFEMWHDGEECTGHHVEWRNHEANVWFAGGGWHGDVIAYGEWDEANAFDAEAIAYAFGFIPELPTDGAAEMFDYYFGGKVMA